MPNENRLDRESKIRELLENSSSIEEAIEKFDKGFDEVSANDETDENSLPEPDESKETGSVDEDEASKGVEGNGSFLTKKKMVVFSVLMLVIFPLFGLGAGVLISEWSALSSAREALDNIAGQRGNIEVVNTELVTFRGQSIPNANIEQKALVNGLVGHESAVFAFSNGKTSENKKILDVYLDFNSAKSRDFMLFNQNSLKGMVENNLIELRVHPVPTGSAYSIYAAEAIAESVVIAPDKTWNLMFELLKISATLNSNSNEDIVNSVVETTEGLGISGIDGESIQNGTFASWIIAVGDDEKLASGFYPPVVFLDDVQVTPDDVFFNDPDAFQRYILNKEK